MLCQGQHKYVCTEYYKVLWTVNHFQVEMFGVTANETGQESAELFQEFLQIQEELFSDLGIHFRSKKNSWSINY